MNTSDSNSLTMKQWNYNNIPVDRPAANEALTPASVASMYQKGQVLTGEILDLIQNDVKLSLSDGTILNATLSDSIPLSIGDTSLFVVKEAANRSLVLKYLPQEPSMSVSPSIDKALEEAGLVKNERNVTIVYELMKEQMSIDKNSILSVVREAVTHKDIPISTIVKLIKHDLPVTSSNASGIEAAIEGKHMLTTQLPQLIDSVSSVLSEVPALEGAVLLRQLSDLFPQLKEELASLMPADQGNLAKNNQITAAPAHNEIEKLLKSFLPSSSGSENLPNVSANLPDGSENLPDISSIKQHVSSILKKELLFDTEHVYNKENGLSKEGLTQYYHKLSEDVDSLVTFLQKETNEQSSPSFLHALTQAQQVKENLDFMKSMNQFFGYVQLPQKSKEDSMQGELFVYTNQKRSRQSDAPVSLLLHLTKPYLGEIDFHLVLSKQHLTANITVIDEAVLNLINAHLPEFYDLLERKNYTVTATVTQKEMLGNPLQELFAPTDSDFLLTSRYSFDKRA